MKKVVAAAVEPVHQVRRGKACHPAVAVRERVDAEEVQGERRGHHQWVKTVLAEAAPVPVTSSSMKKGVSVALTGSKRGLDEILSGKRSTTRLSSVLMLPPHRQ